MIVEDLTNQRIMAVYGLEEGSREIRISFENNTTLEMYHQQDCCEHVRIEDIVGPTNLGGAIWYGLDVKDSEEPEDYMYMDDSHTWTFYTLRTSKGYTDIRWLGESNGYYSESVGIRIKPIEEDLKCER
jgi:hypothetical protein